MNKQNRNIFYLALCFILTIPHVLISSPYEMENLTRGVVAVRTGTNSAYIGWRLFGLDPSGISFNIYRSTGGATAQKINSSAITNSTNYEDSTADLSQTNSYYVRAIVNGVEGNPSVAYTLSANASIQNYLRVPLDQPSGGTTPDNVSYTYSPNDCSVGDLDGDGEYEIVVKWDPSNAKDNSQSGYTGNVYLDAYEINGSGTPLWRIDLGRNIRAGAHYTQFMVYDFDSDGKAELMCKTADGTVSGTGQVIGNGSADYRNSSGYILDGPEYITVFDGQSGAALATENYVPARGNVSDWGDGYGNRVDRFLAGVAYLDGTKPSAIFSRGYYTRVVIVAWDWRNNQLTQRWIFDSDVSGSSYEGTGNHQLSIGDVDSDGRQEIIFGSLGVDEYGSPMWVNYHHGDTLHVSDFIPSRPGLEVFKPSEWSSEPADYMFDANTGQVIWSHGAVRDNGRGVAADIWAGNSGAEAWSAVVDGLSSAATGQNIGRKPSSINFLAWWDADPVRELLNSNHIDKYGTSGDTNLLTASNCSSNNGSKSTPALSGDILGDWREEVIWRETNNTALRVYTTTNLTSMRLFTLMHDPQYRVAIAWQNTGYNQPPHPGFFLGDGMTIPSSSPISYVDGTTVSPDVYQAEDASYGGGVSIDSNNSGFYGSGFANFPSSDGYLEFTGIDGASGGAATLTIRFALGASSSRTGIFSVNGSNSSITFDSTGSWTSWNEKMVSVSLNSGTGNTIRFESNGEDLANIDQITISATGSEFSGYYRLINRNSGKYLEVTNASTSSGANIQQWGNTSHACQEWNIVSTDSGYYHLINRNSGQYMEVINAETSSGANIQQWPNSNHACQEWAIESVGNGYYQLVNRNSDQMADVEGSSTDDGANVAQWPETGGYNQHWQLVEVQ